MTPFSQYDLVQRYNRGEPAAFNEVFKAFYPGVFAFAREFIKNQPDAQDIVAESFTKLFNRKTHFEDLHKLKAYLYLTAKNACLDYLKHIRLHQEKEREIAEHWLIETEGFKEKEERLEIRQLIQKAIDSLPAKCRQIFLLYFTEGLGNSEIAYHLKISKKTVANQKSHAIKLLKITIQRINHFLVLFIILPFNDLLRSFW